MAEQNGNGSTPAVPPGVAIDGKFWTPADFSTRQRLEIRQLVRDSTGDPTIADMDDERVSEEDDLIPAMVYVVRRYYTDGGDESYTIDQAYELRAEDYARMHEEAMAALPPVNGGASKTSKARSKPPSGSSAE